MRSRAGESEAETGAGEVEYKGGYVAVEDPAF